MQPKKFLKFTERNRKITKCSPEISRKLQNAIREFNEFPEKIWSQAGIDNSETYFRDFRGFSDHCTEISRCKISKKSQMQFRKMF